MQRSRDGVVVDYLEDTTISSTLRIGVSRRRLYAVTVHVISFDIPLQAKSSFKEEMKETPIFAIEIDNRLKILRCRSLVGDIVPCHFVEPAKSCRSQNHAPGHVEMEHLFGGYS